MSPAIILLETYERSDRGKNNGRLFSFNQESNIKILWRRKEVSRQKKKQRATIIDDLYDLIIKKKKKSISSFVLNVMTEKIV